MAPAFRPGRVEAAPRARPNPVFNRPGSHALLRPVSVRERRFAHGPTATRPAMTVYVDPHRAGGVPDGLGADGPTVAGAARAAARRRPRARRRRRARADRRGRRPPRRKGEVLHLNARATRLMGDGLFLCDQRLRARDRAADELLAAAIGSTLRYGVASRVAVGDSPGEGDFGVRIVPVAIAGRRTVPVAARGRDLRAARRGVASAPPPRA